MASVRLKLSHIVRCHEESKAAFQQLKSQIEISLNEVEEVFVSLAAPLMRLVGLKTEEMASEGRSSFIVIERDPQNRSGCGLARSEAWTRSSSSGDGRPPVPTLEDSESYQVRIARAREELTAKSRLHLQHLALLLRQIENSVNSGLDGYYRRLDDRRHAVQKVFQKSKAFLDAVHHDSRDPKVIFFAACKVLVAVYDQVGSVFGSLEEDTEELIQEIGKRMSSPLAVHAKRLKADTDAGPTSRLAALAEELGRAARDRAAEVGEARRIAIAAEEGKLEAERKLRELERKTERMKDYFGSYCAYFEVERRIEGDKAKQVEVEEKRLQEGGYGSTQGPRQSLSSVSINLVRSNRRKYPLLSPATDLREPSTNHDKCLQVSRAKTTLRRKISPTLYSL
ncbi:hypothetical protein H6P81_012644 [Aristolochia fimbriata]|uniref:Uncharacterized protein n=1 Tax=Aristolochia fimbriata TaxID=158543 RepID=A0AAV7EF87_ARIFI|nr:hypothetical protein H6P81_012644 [Aristolochia fimbriata]